MKDAVLAGVNEVLLVGGGIREQVEVVIEHLHLPGRLLDRHRRERKRLPADELTLLGRARVVAGPRCREVSVPPASRLRDARLLPLGLVPASAGLARGALSSASSAWSNYHSSAGNGIGARPDLACGLLGGSRPHISATPSGCASSSSRERLGVPSRVCGRPPRGVTARGRSRPSRTGPPARTRHSRTSRDRR